MRKRDKKIQFTEHDRYLIETRLKGKILRNPEHMEEALEMLNDAYQQKPEDGFWGSFSCRADDRSLIDWQYELGINDEGRTTKLEAWSHNTQVVFPNSEHAMSPLFCIMLSQHIAAHISDDQIKPAKKAKAYAADLLDNLFPGWGEECFNRSEIRLTRKERAMGLTISDILTFEEWKANI